ncbi:MAG TPA: UDP-N-acetylmuramoylalanyl-D-glutamyl-2,6-diaminopimelate--D-alanyl-D-alanine ligase, partial [Pararhizobium sp.]|nr:UDP-N-acetylmuramoylalanyl-D-glutamyl-2,6-diaminopimelate--D-alanyl-D-alanine ligase [Pararhizobium sp.]
MSWLWTAEAMIEAMEGRPVGSLPQGITGISIDSRTLAAGDAFFAIKGDRFDGHDFVSGAIINGAALLVVSEAKLPALGRLTVPLIVVDDVLAALGRLGEAARARSEAKIVAVTGSVGKTTTKAMLAQALRPSGTVHAANASFNNHWGVPLTLARMPAEAKFGVFEIGMNHAGEIRPLVKMVRPHVAVVTTVVAAHLGHFKNLGEIAAAKAEIFEGLEPGGAALLNRDNEKFSALKKRAEACGVKHILSFGGHKQADFRRLDVTLHADRSEMRVKIGDDALDVTIGAPGRHIVDNAVAVLGAVSLLGGDVEAAARTLAGATAQKGRGARHVLQHPDGPFLLIDDSYNANPASMRAALAVLAAVPVGKGGKRIAALGDMLELGRFSAKLHAELAGPVAAAGVDRLYLVGDEMAALAEAVPENLPVKRFADAVSLADALKAEVGPGDAVVVKSSLGLGFGRVVAALLD